MSYHRCKKCDRLVLRKFTKLTSTGIKKFTDTSGRGWHGKVCPTCACKDRQDHGIRKYGTKLRSQVTEHRNRLAYEDEAFVKEYFESFGFEVRQTTGTGPDLTVLHTNGSFTVEVKSAYISNGYSYVTSPVYPNRRGDDLVAVVLPNRTDVLFYRMSEHLQKCSNSGARHICIRNYCENTL